MASADVGTLRTRLSFEDEGTSSGLTGFQRDLKGLRSEMNAAKSGGKDYSNSLKGLGQQSDILSRRFKTQQQQVAELRKRYEESKRTKGEDATTTKDLASQYNNATAQMNRTENQLKALNEEIRRQQSPWTKLGENMTNAGDKMQKFGKGMTDFGKSYSMRVTAPIVAGGVAVFKMASDYESAFAGVRKTVDATEAEFKTLSDGIRNMAKELPTAATDIAAIAEQAGQLGIEKENILAFTRTIIDLSEATNLSAEQAGTEFARFANIVGMSQNDFDRLGSSVVALGNTMATTESEIVSMAMRLAAQGKQVGLTEAQIMALAGTMSSLGIESQAGGTAMTTVLKKIDKAVGEGGKSLNGFAKAAKMDSKEFADVWKNEPIQALDMFVKGLSKSGDEGENLSSILADLGIKGIRESDTLLRMAGASDILSGAVETSSAAWKENTALTDEAAQRYATTESQLKVLWNRIKDVGITLGEALIPALMDALEAAEPLIQKIEDGAQAFSDMTKEEQETILKMIGLVAAIGPAAMALGGLATGIGGVLKVGGGLATALGAAGGKGLIGRIGLMGASAGPVGLAVGLTGALALGIYAVMKASEESTEEVVNAIEKRREEIESVDSLIASFDELQKKNKLTTDEVLRYMDIMDELKDAESEEAIKKLTEEQTKLLEKSGFTNDEMGEFLRLNGELVEQAPETAKAISEQGNAYVDVLDALKELNEAERQRLTDDTYMAITDEINKQKQNLEEQEKLQKEIGGLEDSRETTLGKILEEGEKIKGVDVEIARLMKEIDKATGDEQQKLMNKVSLLEEEKVLADMSKQTLEGKLGDLDKEIEKKSKSLGKTEEELAAFDKLTDEYGQMVLFQEGIVSEKGKAVEAVQKEQKELDKAKKKLDEMQKAGKLVGGEYDIQNSKLQEQQGKIDGAKRKLGEMNEIAGKKIYKDIDVSTNPSIDSLNRNLGAPISKTINVRASGEASRLSSYAVGTDYHHGGPALVGEEGPELARLGSRWEMLGFGVKDLPRGTQVFTHDETKSILGSLNRIPAYASGVSPHGEAGRVVDGLNNSRSQNDEATLEQNRILMAILESNKNLEKKPILTEGDIGNAANRHDAKGYSKNNVFTGRVMPT